MMLTASLDINLNGSVRADWISRMGYILSTRLLVFLFLVNCGI